MKLGRKRAAELLKRFRGARILVVGDLMLDRYIIGSVSRISPEAPVPVVHVAEEDARPGGASNVALNIAALGGGASVAGVVGVDLAGGKLLEELNRAAIDTTGTVASAGVRTTEKTRIIAERQQVARVDYEDAAELHAGVLDGLLARVPELVLESTGVIIEDYGKGVICQEVVDVVLDAAKTHGRPVGFDPKDNHQLDIPWLTLATPNYREACMATGLPEEPLGDEPEKHSGLRRAGEVLAERWGTDFLMITLGPHGMYLCPRDAEATVQPTLAQEVFDVSGAGDTVIAVALTAIASGATFEEAASLANHAAGVVVGKVGTATCSVKELLASF